MTIEAIPELDSLRAYFGDISPLPPHRNIIPGCPEGLFEECQSSFAFVRKSSQYLRENAFVIDRGIFFETSDQFKLG